jgi:NAD(P)-dependent dehydrogenase (short-subunit alcohol dehydrogenase family)
MDLGFADATAVVTGGSKGMGLAIAETLGAEGASVAIMARGQQGLDSADPHDVMTWVEQTYGHPCDVGRAGLPEEIASVTAYLASRRNGYVTGATVNVDGGSDFI